MGRQIDQASLYTLVRREPGLAHPPVSRFPLPATFWTRARTRRGRDQALEANALVGFKKTLRNKAESSSASTSRDFANDPPGCVLGRRGARPQYCSTTSTGPSSRLSPTLSCPGISGPG